MTIHSGGFESSDDSSSYTTGSEDEDDAEYTSGDDDAPEGPAPTHTPRWEILPQDTDDVDYEHGFSAAKAMAAARKAMGQDKWDRDYRVLGPEMNAPLAEQMKGHMFRDLDRVPAEYV